MAEYIDRSELLRIESLLDSDVLRASKTASVIYDQIMYDIEHIPAADVAEVNHGKWEWFEEKHGTPIDGYDYDWGWHCSNCKAELSDDYDDPDTPPKMRYCPNCGAKMDLEG